MSKAKSHQSRTRPDHRQRPRSGRQIALRRSHPLWRSHKKRVIDRHPPRTTLITSRAANGGGALLAEPLLAPQLVGCCSIRCAIGPSRPRFAARAASLALHRHLGGGACGCAADALAATAPPLPHRRPPKSSLRCWSAISRVLAARDGQARTQRVEELLDLSRPFQRRSAAAASSTPSIAELTRVMAEASHGQPCGVEGPPTPQDAERAGTSAARLDRSLRRLPRTQTEPPALCHAAHDVHSPASGSPPTEDAASTAPRAVGLHVTIAARQGRTKVRRRPLRARRCSVSRAPGCATAAGCQTLREAHLAPHVAHAVIAGPVAVGAAAHRVRATL